MSLRLHEEPAAQLITQLFPVLDAVLLHLHAMSKNRRMGGLGRGVMM